MFDGAGDVEIHDSWLNDGALIFEVEFENAIHAREDEHQSAGTCERATGEPGAGAATENRDVMLRGDPDDLRDFGGCGRENNYIGAAFFDGAVVFVEDEIFGAGENSVLPEKFLERPHEVAMRLRIRRWWGSSHGAYEVSADEGMWGDDLDVH